MKSSYEYQGLELAIFAHQVQMAYAPLFKYLVRLLALSCYCMYPIIVHKKQGISHQIRRKVRDEIQKRYPSPETLVVFLRILLGTIGADTFLRREKCVKRRFRDVVLWCS